MLEINGVEKSFGKKKVLCGISLSLGKGECFGLLGPNGAGKTTLINLITGFIRPDAGSIIFFNQSQETRNFAALKKRMGVVPQEIALYENLSVSDNLKYFGELYGMSGKSLAGRIRELLEWIGLDKRGKDKVKILSGGMKRRLNLAAGLLHSPRLLLADEPTVGVDPQSRIFIYDLFDRLKETGVNVLYTTHYLPEIERLCNRVAILNSGKIAFMGRIEEIANSGGGPGKLEAAFFELTGTGGCG